MLHDPRQEQKTFTEVYSIASLVAYLKQQPPDMKYPHENPDNCLLYHFARVMGASDPGRVSRGLVKDQRYWDIVVSAPWDYHHALARASAWMRDREFSCGTCPPRETGDSGASPGKAKGARPTTVVDGGRLGSHPSH